MAPAIITLDNTPDLDDMMPSITAKRTLLLAPPSLASNEPALAFILSQHDRSATDLQMLDRLSAGLVRLPQSTYDLVLILSSPQSSINEAVALLSRDVLGSVAEAMRPGASLRAHENKLDGDAKVAKEAVFAGLVPEKDAGGYTKPDYGDGGEVVSLFKLKKNKSNAGPAVEAATVKKANGHVETVVLEPARVNANGIATINLDDDLDGDDDDIIDENTLLTDADLEKKVQIPPECIPKVGKRRRACKDCSCGLREQLEAEDAAKRSEADAKLNNIATLEANDLAEVDFTVQGKVGSCGSCALGDAFRCAGCPYIGLPPFEWGQEVKLLNNEVQL